MRAYRTTVDLLIDPRVIGTPDYDRAVAAIREAFTGGPFLDWQFRKVLHPVEAGDVSHYQPGNMVWFEEPEVEYGKRERDAFPDHPVISVTVEDLYALRQANEKSGSVSLDEGIHNDHAARGENHWFTCGLCDDAWGEE